MTGYMFGKVSGLNAVPFVRLLSYPPCFGAFYRLVVLPRTTVLRAQSEHSSSTECHSWAFVSFSLLLFLQGVYFADVSSKSANYCRVTRTAGGDNVGVLLLCEVSLGTM